MRLGVSLLAAPALLVGVWALLIPRSLYDDFPAAAPTTSTWRVGALNLALGTLLAQAALAAWLVYALPHFGFHATELGAFSLLDNSLNLITLGLAVLLPLTLLAATCGGGTTSRRRADTGGGR